MIPLRFAARRCWRSFRCSKSTIPSRRPLNANASLRRAGNYRHSFHFVPVDFEKESLAEALTRSSYDPQVPSFFSWLGVTYYLTRDAIFATLRSIAEIVPSGSTVIFDYLDTDAFVPEKAANRVKITIRYARQNAGEPMITGFEPSALATDLASLGFYLQENLSPTDIEERYFKGRTDNYHACEHLHFARAVVE